MSHANGEVWSLDGKCLGFYEYDGTSDIVLPAIWPTREEMQKHWRNQPWNECHCGKRRTEVLIYTDYGGGSYWHGTACLLCMAVVGGADPYGQYSDEHLEMTEGHPFPNKVGVSPIDAAIKGPGSETAQTTAAAGG